MVSTCVELFEGLVGKKCDPCIWDNAQDGRSETFIQCLYTFFLGDAYKDMHNVTVPVKDKQK